MNTTSNAVPAVVFATLVLAPGCFSADDPALSAQGSSTGDEGSSTGDGLGTTSDVPAPSSGGAPEPTGESGDEPTGNDGYGSEDDGSGDADETTGAPDAPTVVEVSPEDGAVGVPADAQIVIRFSESMDQAATQAAYQSSDIPAGSVTFSWNPEGDELTITPNDPLAYAEGSSPDVDPLSYSFTLSSVGESEEGASLTGETEVTFSTLRRLSLEFEQDDEMSGRVRDLGGATLVSTQYAFGDTSTNDITRGFVTFDLASIPESPTAVENANLHAEFGIVYGNPFIDLGVVLYQHVTFETFEDSLFDIEPIGVTSGLFATLNDDEVDRDVTEVAAEVLADPEGFNNQLQLRFLWAPNETDGDFDNDTITMMASALRLDLQVLVP